MSTITCQASPWSPGPTQTNLSPQKDLPTFAIAKCVSDPSQIINQLSNENPGIRCQCLAFLFNFISVEKESEPVRCSNHFQSPSQPSALFNKAKRVLEKSIVVDIDTFVENVAPILFCDMHCRSRVFTIYHNSLREHWKGDGNPTEGETLRLMRQVFQVPLVKISFVRPSSPSPSIPARPEVETKSHYTLPNAQPSQAKTGNINTSFPRFQRVRSFSNPLAPLKGADWVKSELDTTSDESDEEDQISPQSSPTWQVPKHTFDYPKSSHEVVITIRPKKANNCHKRAKSTSTRPKDDLPVPKPPHEQISFSKNDWNTCNFEPILKTPPSRPSTHHLRLPIPNGISKDDIFMTQLSGLKLPDSSVHQKASAEDTKPGPPAQAPDMSHNRNVDEDIKNILEEKVSRGGYVYVFAAPKYFAARGERSCVKIGSSHYVDGKLNFLETSCKISGIYRVQDREDMPHQLYERIERLAHAELANFKKTIACAHGAEIASPEHREWFEVDEQVALRVVQRWRSFVKLNPYENGLLRSDWSNLLLRNLEPQGRAERDDDHGERNRRWSEWIELGAAKIEKHPHTG